MSKAIKDLWILAGLGVLCFVIALFLVDSDEMLWRIFSITMPVVGIGFWGAVILSVIEYFNSKK